MNSGDITVWCRRPFDTVSLDYSRPNLYSRHRCRRVAHCNLRHSHHHRRRVLLVFFWLSQAPPRVSYATLFVCFETKPRERENIEKLWEINHKKSRRVSRLNHKTNRLKGRLFEMVYLAFFTATSYGVKN